MPTRNNQPRTLFIYTSQILYDWIDGRKKVIAVPVPDLRKTSCLGNFEMSLCRKNWGWTFHWENLDNKLPVHFSDNHRVGKTEPSQIPLAFRFCDISTKCYQGGTMWFEMRVSFVYCSTHPMMASSNNHLKCIHEKMWQNMNHKSCAVQCTEVMNYITHGR